MNSAFHTPHSALGWGGGGRGAEGRRRRGWHLHRPRRPHPRRRDRGSQGRHHARRPGGRDVSSTGCARRHAGHRAARPRHHDRDQRAARAARRAGRARHDRRVRGSAVARAPGSRRGVRPGATPSAPARGPARRRGGHGARGAGGGARGARGRRGGARRRGMGALGVMRWSGGTRAPAAAAAHAASLALSGPAGGVVGARLVGAAVGLSDLLTLDMGGTSADASLVAGGAPLADGEAAVAGVPLALPAVLIETVSAGGGSIAHVDEGGALRVGPESAGAMPGPACYGRGGQRPTVTDACLMLGWLDAGRPLADQVRLDPAAAERALRLLGPAAGRDPARIAAGIVAVATAVMARALKRVSVARGLDPRRMALLPFGGAGALFGCQLAEALGMGTIVIPPHPGALSALGLAAAAERADLLASFHRAAHGLEPRDVAGR